MKRFTAIFALILALIILLTACGGDAEPTEATQMQNIYQKSDPAQDDTLNILMIGNSLCYYYVEELYGMLEAAGLLLALGYGQGTGQAMNYGNIYETQFGFTGGMSAILVTVLLLVVFAVLNVVVKTRKPAEAQ